MILRITARQIGTALILGASGFLFGFAYSRFVIDLSLRQADAVLLRSAQEFERQQTTLMQQFRTDDEMLQRKVSAIHPVRGNR